MSSGGRALLIPENVLSGGGALTTAGSSASASMDDANLLLDDPSRFWRSTDNYYSRSYVKLTINDGTHMSADCFAMVGHNLRRGDQYRFVPTNSADIIGGNYEVMVPTGTISSSQVTGPSTPNLHLDVDEGATPGGTWLAETAPGTWTARFSFGTPATAPKTGANRQVFWVYVRANGAHTHGATAATLKCELFETGGVSALANLGTKTIYGTTGQWVFFSWNASLLATSDGSAVEIKLTSTSRDNSSLGTTYIGCEVDAITWPVEKTTAYVPVTSGDFDWVTYDPFSGDASFPYHSAVVPPSSPILVQFGSILSFRYGILMIRSDHAPTDYDYLTEVQLEPDGYVQIGCLVIGQSFTPSINVSYGKLMGTIDTSPRQRTYGGQMFGSRRPVRRMVSVKLDFLTPAEAHALVDRVLWQAGLMKPMIVSILPDDATQSKHTTIFGVVRNAENWISIKSAQGYENSVELEFEEIL